MAVVPSAKWLMLNKRLVDKPLATGLDAAWDRICGYAGRLRPRQSYYMSRARRVLEMEDEFNTVGSSKLAVMAESLREKFRCRRDAADDLDRAFAVIREVADRQTGLRPFAVQVAGAFALYEGCITEMATGEGKTLTATMPATVAGWRGAGCHIITVNDYLAKRDAEWMESIYRFCHASVGYIEQETTPDERRAAYAADITYCTNKEVTADFLRDRLTLGACGGLAEALIDQIAAGSRGTIDGLVQRGLEYAIIDEADSILIDEAVTPLIISGSSPRNEQADVFQEASKIADDLVADEHYKVAPRYREVKLTEPGMARVRQLTEDMGGLWRGARRSQEMVVRALTAKVFYRRDHHYIIDDDEILIVDEFTGRIMPDRQWRDGLHQAVEAMEGVEVTAPKETLARVSFQRFFRMYSRLSGMTGTAKEASAEFWQIYHLPVVVIPTNKPCARKNLPDAVFTDGQFKWDRILAEIRRVHDEGRPVLVGTRSVGTSEHLSGLLKDEGLGHQVLNAVRHREEAQIVAEAGQPGRITVATNMAGRGTDIKLGRGVAELGGLHVIATEHNESGRIDRQLFGRCARQGDPGTAQAIVSLGDEFVSRYGKGLIKYLRKRHGHTVYDISSRLTNASFKLAQFRAERLALRQRQSVMQSDKWLDDHLSFAGKE